MVPPPTPPRARTTTSRLVSLTQRFFLKGEQQEATQYKDVILDVDDAVEPKPEFDSFDKIPRRRRPLLLLTGVVLVGVVGVATWRSFHLLSRPGSSVAAASQAMVAARPDVTPAIVPQPPAPPAVAPQVVPINHAAAALPTQPATAPAADEPAVAPKAKAKGDDARARATSEQTSASAPAARRTESSRRTPAAEIDEPTADDNGASAAAARPRSKPLRGYAWSPENHGLVPADNAAPSSAEIVAPSSDETVPSGAAADRPAATSPPTTTSPAPFEGRAPGPKAESAPIIE